MCEATVSAFAAGISAICALITLVVYLFSRQLSRREMLDLVKVDILEVVSNAQAYELWKQTMALSAMLHGLPKVKELADFLAAKESKYKKDKWKRLILPALEELKREGHSRV